MFFGDDPLYRTYRNLIDQFGSDEIFAVGFKLPKPFSPEEIQRLKQMVNKIESLEDIERVDSILSAEKMEGSTGELTIIPYYQLVIKDKIPSEQVISELCSDDLYRNFYISADGNHTAMLVYMIPNRQRPVEKLYEIYQSIVDVFLDAGYKRRDIHFAGLQAQIAEVIRQSYLNIFLIFPICILFLSLAVFAFYRQFIPVLITMGIAMVSVSWTMAFAVILDREINILMALVPSVVLIVAFSDIIHLCNAYSLELDNGLSKMDAITKSGAEVGKACMHTSLTTLVGFASMSFVPSPGFQLLGVVLGFGVAIALMLALVLVPVLVSLVDKRYFLRVKKGNRVRDLLDKVIRFCRVVSTKKPVLVLITFTIIILLGIDGFLRIKIETDMSKRLDESNHIRIADRYFRDHFHGTNFMDVFIDTGKEGGVMEPFFLSQLSKFQDEILSIDDVDHVTSLVDIIKRIHSVMAIESDLNFSSVNELPGSRALIAQYLLLFEMSSESDLERIVDFNRRKLRLSARILDHAFRNTSLIGDRINEMAASYFDSNVTVQASGYTYILGRWLDDLVIGQRRGLAFAILSITILMVIGLRSARVGLMSMVPNILPLLFLLGYLGYFWDAVDSDVMAICMMAIGLGVDDTIHFLSRLKLESSRNENIDNALYETFHFTGRAIIQTTVILAIGFSPFVISDYFSTRMMGTLMPMVLAVALAADLFMVPAMAKLGIIRFRDKKTSK